MTEGECVRWLYVYAGPGGPISARFNAPSLDDAVAIVEAREREWYDDAADELGLGPDADEQEIEAALTDQGWASRPCWTAPESVSLHQEEVRS